MSCHILFRGVVAQLALSSVFLAFCVLQALAAVIIVSAGNH